MAVMAVVMEVVAMARWGRRWERQMAAVAAADVSAGWPADGMVPIGGMGAPPPTVKNDNCARNEQCQLSANALHDQKARDISWRI